MRHGLDFEPWKARVRTPRAGSALGVPRGAPPVSFDRRRGRWDETSVVSSPLVNRTIWINVYLLSYPPHEVVHKQKTFPPEIFSKIVA